MSKDRKARIVFLISMGFYGKAFFDRIVNDVW